MSCLIPEKWLVVSVGLLIKEGKVLLGERASGDGLWEFPGGHLEAGEQAQSAMIRELREELGIQVKESEIAGCLCDHTKDPPRLIALFYVTAWAGEIKKNCHSRLAWLSPKELAQKKLPNINPSLFGEIIGIIDKKLGNSSPPLSRPSASASAPIARLKL